MSFYFIGCPVNDYLEAPPPEDTSTGTGTDTSTDTTDTGIGTITPEVDQTEFTVLFESRKVDADIVSIITPSDGKTLFDTGKCAKIRESDFKDLKISIGVLVLCDSDDKTRGISPCSSGNYTIWYNPRTSGPGRPVIGYSLTKKDQASENCDPLIPLGPT